MKILLTGSSGYIGRRLLPVLVEAGHKVIFLVRDRRRFSFNPIFLTMARVAGKQIPAFLQ